MPLRKVHGLTSLWFGLPVPLLISFGLPAPHWDNNGLHIINPITTAVAEEVKPTLPKLSKTLAYFCFAGPYPQYGWDFPEEILEKFRNFLRKRSQSVSWSSPREYGWDPPSLIIQGI